MTLGICGVRSGERCRSGGGGGDGDSRIIGKLLLLLARDLLEARGNSNDC